MKKIVMIYDQIQAGVGTKDDGDLGLGIIKEAVGPAIMMENHLKEIDAKVIACLYAGSDYFINNQEEVIDKMDKMVQKINPDMVICGPCFNFEKYANMAAYICAQISKKYPCVMACSKENEEIIKEFKDKITIIKTPKKGESGLNDSLHMICQVINEKYNNDDLEKYSEYIY